MDFVELARFGVPTLLALAILGLIHILNKKYRESENGDRRARSRQMPTTLKGMLANLDASTRMLTEILCAIEETKIEVRNVANIASLHGAGSRSEKIREESRDLLRELLMEIKHRGV